MSGKSVDFSLDGCHKFWKDFDDKSVIDVINLLESVESWAVDRDADAEEKLIAFGQKISNVKKIDSIDDLENVLKICAGLKMSRKLRFMQLIDSFDEGSASRLITYAQEQQYLSQEADFFLSRNVIFERMRILNRMLSADRLKVIFSLLN